MLNSIHQNFQFSTPFLRGFKKLKLPIVDSKGVPAWPEFFPLEKIEQVREIVGHRYFSSQMMLEYLSEEKARLDPGALHFYDTEFDKNTSKLGDIIITGVCVYWDPSGGRKNSDNSVCVLVYKDDKNRRAFIHDLRYLQVSDTDLHPLASQCDKVLDFMRLYNQRNIAVEVNGIGNALPEILREVANKREQSIVIEKIVNHQRKELRILDAIEPLLTTGRLYAHESVKKTLLLSEMLGWSPMVRFQSDDGLDAVAGALRLRAIPSRSLGQSFRTLSAKTDFKI